jgi:putative peptidoglycan lipid II flippase
MIEVFKVVAPRLVTMFIIQLMFIARDNLASRLEQVGAVTALTYGWMLMQVPETLLGTAIATALLPTLAEYAARNDWILFRQTIEKAVRVLIALTLPIGVIAIIGLRPIVKAAFGFDDAGTSLLVWTTSIYMATLTGYTLQEVFARSFYARREALIPLASVAIRFAAYILIGWVALRSNWGPAGIAAAELSLTLEALVMWLWLNRRTGQTIQLEGALLRGGAAALISAVVGFGASELFGGQLGVVTAFGAMALAAALSLPILLPDLRTLLKL